MIEINLIDESVLAFRRRRRRAGRWILSTAVAGVVATIPLLMEWTRHQQVVTLRGEQVALEARIGSTRSMLNDLGIEIRNAEAQTDRANALRSKRSWSGLLGLISTIVPDELWFVSLATDPPQPARGNRDLRGAAAPGRDVAGATDGTPRVVTMKAPRALTFEGYALDHRDLYEFMSRLKDSDVFADVSLTKAAEEPVLSSKAVRFSVHCVW